MTHPPVLQRRSVDSGPFKRFRAWWERWGDPATSAWLFAVTVALLILAVSYYRSQRHQENDAAIAAYQSTLSCRRTRAYGPALAVAYQRFQILTPPQLSSYRAGIPKSCPPLPPRPSGLK